jgi:hypothetical protein
MEQSEQLQINATTLGGASTCQRTRRQWHPPLWTTFELELLLLLIV